MTKTVINIYQTRLKSRTLNEIGTDAQSRVRSMFARAWPALSLALFGLVATGFFYAIISLNATYLYQLVPALAIIGMVLLLRSLSIPVEFESNKSKK